MSSIESQKTLSAWTSLESVIVVPHNDKEYEKLVALLDELIDEVGEDESHPLASMIEVIGVLIENYGIKQLKNLP